MPCSTWKVALSHLIYQWANADFKQCLGNNIYEELIGHSFQEGRLLESSVQCALRSNRCKMFPPIRRGAPFDVYLTSSGNNGGGRGSMWCRMVAQRYALPIILGTA